MFQIIGILAGILAAISYIPYTKDILRKKVKPERASWLIWTVLAGIAFFSQLSKGATHSLWFTGLDSIGAFLTFVLAIKFGTGGLTRRDVIGLIAAGIGLVLWHFTHNAIYALSITIGIDAIGASLTVVKTLEQPSTETYPMWVIICVASILAIASIGKFDLTLIAYPFYIFLANFAVVVAIYVGHKLKRT
jgi:glucan phosphoethanolaminetransferase (alkaline phosphatase superfamily)